MTDHTSPATDREAPLVHVIDDDVFVRESIQELLRCVGLRAWTYDSTEKFIATERPDVAGCLVLDVRLPGRSGLELHRELSEHGIYMPVIFITGHGDIPMSVAAMKAGAIEFLTKPFRDQDFVNAVNRAIDLDRDCRRNAIVIDELRERYNTLTAREREVFSLVVTGRLNKQIAGDLGLSEVTVKVHRAHIVRKLRANSLPELVRIWDRLAAAQALP